MSDAETIERLTQERDARAPAWGVIAFGAVLWAMGYLVGSSCAKRADCEARLCADGSHARIAAVTFLRDKCVCYTNPLPVIGH